jgi:transposase
VVDLERESRVDVLRRAALTQDAEIRRLLRLNEEMRETIVRLEAQLADKKSDDPSVAAELRRIREILAQRERALFGESSERRPDTNPKPEPAAKPKPQGHGPKAQPSLIEQPVEHELDVADRACSSCGGHLEEWRGKEETSEEIDVVGVQYILKKHLRKKYRCGCGAAVETAPLPEPRLVPGGRYSTRFALHVAISKYDDDLPLERLAQAMKRAGLDVESQTLWDYLWALYVVLKPVVDRLHVYATAQDVAVVDETTWPLLGVRGRKSKAWYVVAIAVEKAIVYRIVHGRSKDDIASALLGFHGTAVTDGYAAYPAIAAERPGMLVAVCWAHARRKFVEAEKSYPAECAPILDDIGKLFAIERALAEREADVEEIERVRQESSRPLVVALGERAARTPHLANSSLGEALTYLRNQWTGLSRFLDDARLPLSTNEVERALRTPVLGRKNHYGSKSERGTEVSAAMYTLIETAKHLGLNPAAYLAATTAARLRGEPGPLPHEFAAAAAASQ